MSSDDLTDTPGWKPFGDWIDELQAAHRPRLTDAELARRVGISRQHLGAIKRGESGTKKPVIVSLALSLGVDPDEACDKAGLRGTKPDDADIRLARSLVPILRDIPRDRRSQFEEAILKNAQSMAALMKPAA